ncbi:MAG: Crp/Fnr family transcriptional regulator [Anaerovorax sp.]
MERVEELAALESLFPFWKRMTEGQKTQMTGGCKALHFKPGQSVHGMKTGCTGVIAVKEGRLRGYLCSDEGKEITLFRLLKGEVCMLTASCIIKNISFDLMVDAEIKSTIVVIDPVIYEKIAKENTEVDTFMGDLISRRFSEVMWIMEQVLFMKMDKRLAIFLLDEEALSETGAITLSHQEIADHIGTAREVISRMLKYFANSGLIQVSRKEILILDDQALQKLAE